MSLALLNGWAIMIEGSLPTEHQVYFLMIWFIYPRVGNFIIQASGSDKPMLCGSSVARAAQTISAVNNIQKG